MVSRGTTRGKKAVNAVGKDLPAKLFQTLPSKAVDLAVRRIILPQFNFTVSNVRGPSMSLYLAGAKLFAMMPINMLLDGMGLSVTGFSYNGVLWVCAVADRAMLPDPGFFTQCFQESFAEHLAISLPVPEEKARPPRRAPRKAKPDADAGKPPANAPARRSRRTGVQTG